MSSLITIRRCASLPEALVCKSLLEAAGIHAAVENYYHASNDWLLIPGLQGVSVAVPSADYDAAKNLIIDAAEAGPDALEAEFGAYQKPRRYGVAALWYMILHQLGIALFVLMYLSYGVILLLRAALPEIWFRAKPSPSGRDWIPEVSAGNFNPIIAADWNAEGFLFVFFVILVFMADRLIKPRADIEDDAE